MSLENTQVTNEKIEITRGANLIINATLEITVNGVDQAANLTGGVAYLTVLKKPGDSYADALLTFTSADSNDIEITDAGNGRVKIKFKPDDTKDIPAPGVYWFDCWVKLSTGDEYPVNDGRFEIFKEKTSIP